MSKKLMLLAAGALSALAFAAVPAVSSAAEPILHCEKIPCTYTVTGGVAELSTVGGNTVKCTTVTGNGSYSALSGATGKVQLTFHECREQVTIFKFSCTGTGQPTRTIKTNEMVTHNIYIEPINVNTGTAGILITGANVTFTCAGFEDFTVTGNVIGHVEDPKCNKLTNEYTLNFGVTAHGKQQFKTQTTDPALGEFNLTSNDDTGGPYEEAAQKGTGHIKFNQNVVITC